MRYVCSGPSATAFGANALHRVQQAVRVIVMLCIILELHAEAAARHWVVGVTIPNTFTSPQPGLSFNDIRHKKSLLALRKKIGRSQ
jgi:hypothetical protein